MQDGGRKGYRGAGGMQWCRMGVQGCKMGAGGMQGAWRDAGWGRVHREIQGCGMGAGMDTGVQDGGSGYRGD